MVTKIGWNWSLSGTKLVTKKGQNWLMDQELIFNPEKIGHQNRVELVAKKGENWLSKKPLMVTGSGIG